MEALPSMVEPSIPRSDKARAMDEHLERVREFLISEGHPRALNDSEFKALVHFSMCFFV